MLHGSRSGRIYSVEQEYTGTVGYAKNGAEGKFWTLTIGERKYTMHGSVSNWGWHAGDPYSRQYIGAEFAQARLGDPITDTQLDALVYFFVNDARPIYPQLPLFLICHSDVTPGNTDPVEGSDSFAFKQRVYQHFAKYGINA